MGSLFLTLVFVLVVCGTRGGLVFREWRTYVPFYGTAPRIPYTNYYTYYTPLLPSTYGNHANPTGGFVPQIGQIQNGIAPLGTGPNQFGAPQVRAGTMAGTPQNGNGATQGGYGTAQMGNSPAQTGNGAGAATAQPNQTGNGSAPTAGGAPQNGNGAAQTGNGGGQTVTGGSPPTSGTGGGQSNIWTGYTMHQSSEYPGILQKVNAALQANGPELIANKINFAGYKTVGTESQTGPGTVSLVNFGDRANKNCYAYLVEPTGKTPEIPKESILCAN